MGWSNQAVSLIVLTEETSGYSGMFGYSPSPGAGNLVFSLTAASGTDPYGNAYVGPGLALYNAGSLIGEMLPTGLKIVADDGSYVQAGGEGFQTSAVQLGTGLAIEHSPGTIGSGQSQTGIDTVIGTASITAYPNAQPASVGVLSPGTDGTPSYITGEQGGVSGLIPMLDTLPNSSGMPAFRFHMGSFSGTTDSSGNLSISHGASFTPKGVLAVRDQTSTASGPFCAGVFNLSSSSFGAHFVNGTSSYTSSAVKGFFLVWG